MRDDTAVSPVIGTLLILATFTVVAATVITVGRPQIVEYQERGEFQTVLNQMSRLASDLTQLTISGNTNEVRQPTLKIPNGDIQVDRGHHVAISSGLVSRNHSDAAGQSAPPGEHPGFYVAAVPALGPEWDADDGEILLYYLNSLHSGSGIDLYADVAHWDGAEWTTTYTTPTKSVKDGEALETIVFRDAAGAAVTLSDGPWRITVYYDALLTDILWGEVYLYDLTRLTYHYSGESGPRSAYLENGAIFITEHNRHTLVRAGLLSAPSAGLGGSAVTARAMVLEDSGTSASGRSEIGFLMRVSDTERWLDRSAAITLRIQLSGAFPELWYDHLDDKGFSRDAHPGVMYVDAQANAGEHTVFPFNVIETTLDLRFRQK